jgi:heme a synthase
VMAISSAIIPNLGAKRWWALLTLLWILLQGTFGALTVTMKLRPLIVTAHLLGGLGLLMLLAVQTPAFQSRAATCMRPSLRRGFISMAGLTLIQVGLGGWVSTNYAALACMDVSTCQGQLWPPMDFSQGFTLWRALGYRADGQVLGFDALTAIHMAHRLGAVVLVLAMLTLIWRLYASQQARLQRWAWVLVFILIWQILSGLSNVVLGWPLWAALAHSAGAAALLSALVVMWAHTGKIEPNV